MSHKSNRPSIRLALKRRRRRRKTAGHLHAMRFVFCLLINYSCHKQSTAAYFARCTVNMTTTIWGKRGGGLLTCPHLTILPFRMIYLYHWPSFPQFSNVTSMTELAFFSTVRDRLRGAANTPTLSLVTSVTKHEVALVRQVTVFR